MKWGECRGTIETAKATLMNVEAARLRSLHRPYFLLVSDITIHDSLWSVRPRKYTSYTWNYMGVGGESWRRETGEDRLVIGGFCLAISLPLDASLQTAPCIRCSVSTSQVPCFWAANVSDCVPRTSWCLRPVRGAGLVHFAYVHGCLPRTPKDTWLLRKSDGQPDVNLTFARKHMEGILLVQHASFPRDGTHSGVIRCCESRFANYTVCAASA